MYSPVNSFTEDAYKIIKYLKISSTKGIMFQKNNDFFFFNYFKRIMISSWKPISMWIEQV